MQSMATAPGASRSAASVDVSTTTLWLDRLVLPSLSLMADPRQRRAILAAGNRTFFHSAFWAAPIWTCDARRFRPGMPAVERLKRHDLRGPKAAPTLGRSRGPARTADQLRREEMFDQGPAGGNAPCLWPPTIREQ